MPKVKTLTHEFVEYIPDRLVDGVLYVATKYATVTHRCCCGCGLEVVTPLSPRAWKLEFDGESISLYPSIGNWNFPCQSHYWISRSRVQWDRKWSRAEIDAARAEAKRPRRSSRSATGGKDGASGRSGDDRGGWIA